MRSVTLYVAAVFNTLRYGSSYYTLTSRLITVTAERLLLTSTKFKHVTCVRSSPAVTESTQTTRRRCERNPKSHFFPLIRNQNLRPPSLILPNSFPLNSFLIFSSSIFCSQRRNLDFLCNKKNLSNVITTVNSLNQHNSNVWKPSRHHFLKLIYTDVKPIRN